MGHEKFLNIFTFTFFCLSPPFDKYGKEMRTVELRPDILEILDGLKNTRHVSSLATPRDTKFMN